jgi:serine/threonine-protein kinase
MGDSVPPASFASRLAVPGAILAGKYRMDAAIGYGGMGSVWRATHLGLGEPVAIKLVSSELVRSREGLRRFDNEAKAAAKIGGRHVPHVFDNGVLEDGTPFLVMDLLQGRTLFARIHQEGPIPLPETVSILDQCGRALTRAHSLGIIHRDIKPDNVFLAQSIDEDAGYVVKVLDFGIAKVTDTSNTSISATRTGAILGTPTFMSPEQARGIRAIDSRADLYSLGLVAYTMLTGNLAFTGESVGDLLIQICVHPLPSLRAAAPWLPPAMEDWFQKACARDPDARFPTARALIDALRVAAGISAAPPGWPASAPLNTPAGPGGALGDAGIAAQLPLPSTTDGASLALPSPTNSRSNRVLWGACVLIGLVALSGAGVAFGVIRHGARLASHAVPSSSAPSPVATVLPRDIAPLPVETQAAPSPAGSVPLTTGPSETSRRRNGSVVHPSTPATAMPPKPPSTMPSPAVKPSGAVPPKPTGTIDLGY